MRSLLAPLLALWLPPIVRPVVAQEPGTAPAPAAKQVAIPKGPAYREHDLRAVITLRKDGEKHSASIDANRLQSIVDDLEAHARCYPPTFDTKEERALAQREAETLGKLLATLLQPTEGGKEAAPALLFLAARIEATGHNLDVKGASNRAIGYFERLLAAEPKHVAGNWHFGAFWSGTAKGQTRALPYLEKAIELGETRAHYTLAVTYVLLDEHDKAKVQLRVYLDKHPGDAGARKMLEALDAPGLKVERKVNGKPSEPPKDNPKRS